MTKNKKTTEVEQVETEQAKILLVKEGMSISFGSRIVDRKYGDCSKMLDDVRFEDGVKNHIEKGNLRWV